MSIEIDSRGQIYPLNKREREKPTPYTAIWLSWDSIQGPACCEAIVLPNEPLGQDTAGQTEPVQHYWSALSSGGDLKMW